MLDRIREDIATVFEKDPAARSVIEVITCYPGMQALWLHRISHALWKSGWLYLARLLSYFSRFLTNVDIHPGAVFGRRVVIDHGIGVVIGETSEIGDDTLIYQGVVLGGTSHEKVKRHPTIGKHVVIGTGASVLGAITVGDYAKIGAGSVVNKEVPSGSTVVGVPGRIRICQCPVTGSDLDHNIMPDPIAEGITRLHGRIEQLEEKIKQLETRQ